MLLPVTNDVQYDVQMCTIIISHDFVEYAEQRL